MGGGERTMIRKYLTRKIKKQTPKVAGQRGRRYQCAPKCQKEQPRIKDLTLHKGGGR